MTRLATNVLLLCALGASHAGPSEPSSSSGPVDVLEPVLATIEEEVLRNGHNSEALIEPLAALALLYRESGDNRLAAATIERALHIVRVNYGVHSLDQAPWIEQSIAIQEANGNFANAWALEQQLLTLVKRHPEDLRTIPVFREIADGRMDLLRRYVAGERPPQIILGCFYRASRFSDSSSCHSGRSSVAIRSILSEAQENYLHAIDTILRNELYSSSDLRELELELVRNVYLYGNNLFVPAPYDFGRQRLQRLVDYDIASAAPWPDRATALARLADWDLSFSHNSLALEEYEDLYRQLKEARIAPVSIEEIFSPEIPVVVPAFLPNPLASEGRHASTGYIDVAFDITQYGLSKRIEILGTTENATDAAKDRLVRLIKRSRFRPRMIAGRFRRQSGVVLRYYLDG